MFNTFLSLANKDLLLMNELKRKAIVNKLGKTFQQNVFKFHKRLCRRMFPGRKLQIQKVTERFGQKLLTNTV